MQPFTVHSAQLSLWLWPGLCSTVHCTLCTAVSWTRVLNCIALVVLSWTCIVVLSVLGLIGYIQHTLHCFALYQPYWVQHALNCFALYKPYWVQHTLHCIALYQPYWVQHALQCSAVHWPQRCVTSSLYILNPHHDDDDDQNTPKMPKKIHPKLYKNAI